MLPIGNAIVTLIEVGWSDRAGLGYTAKTSILIRSKIPSDEVQKLLKLALATVGFTAIAFALGCAGGEVGSQESTGSAPTRQGGSATPSLTSDSRSPDAVGERTAALVRPNTGVSDASPGPTAIATLKPAPTATKRPTPTATLRPAPTGVAGLQIQFEVLNYFDRAVEFNNAGEYQKAILEMNKALRILPSDGEIYYARGLIHLGSENYSAAIEDFGQAIRLDPAYGDAYANRAKAYSKLDQFDRAIDDLSEVIRLDPDNRVYLSRRALNYSIIGQLRNALDDLDELVRLDPSIGGPYSSRAVVYALLNMDEQAELDFDRAVESGFSAEVLRARIQSAQRIRN